MSQVNWKKAIFLSSSILAAIFYAFIHAKEDLSFFNELAVVISLITGIYLALLILMIIVMTVWGVFEKPINELTKWLKR